MAKAKRLTNAFCKVAGDGEHADGGGLVLRVGNGGSQRSWILRKMVKGRRHLNGLGGFPQVSLADARKTAKAMSDQLTGNVKPARQPEPATVAVAEPETAPLRPIFADLAAISPAQQTAVAGRTFATVASETIEFHSAALSSDRQARDWRASLANHAYPIIGDKPIDEITSQDVLRVLKPIWHTKKETATRVKQRMHRVFDYAIVNGDRDKANPVNGIERGLGYRSNTSRNQPSLPYSEVAGAIHKIRTSRAFTSTKLAMEFIILTVARHGEVRKMTWADIDGDVWMAAEDHQKMRHRRRVNHRVPLSSRAMEILKEARQLGDCEPGSLVFPGKNGKGISEWTFLNLLKYQNIDCVPHGFRASFRTWGMEQVGVAWSTDAMERALAHAVGNAEVEAYARSDMFEQRRKMMEDWATYLAS